ncbi:MAG TPA: T9SS type A sorting domain-containing protein [Bacteroidales bacterium]|nr:T9SS type A sorting domain-containing protein [Bacteroidales bacterium]
MKKSLLFLLCLGLTASLSFGQELIQNGDFELPDDGRKYNSVDSIPSWHQDDPTNQCAGRDFWEENGVGWHWDDAPGIYQVIGTVPSVTTNYDISFDATCMYTYWGSNYVTDVYVIFSSFAGIDTIGRVPIDTLTFDVSALSDDWFVWETIDSVFTIEEGSPVAGENLVFEIEIYNSSLFGYGESWTYLYYDDVSVFASTPTSVKEVDDNGINVIAAPGMLRITAQKNIDNARVFDLAGKLVIDAKPNSSDVSMNVDRLNRGVYIVKVNANGKTLTRKVVL